MGGAPSQFFATQAKSAAGRFVNLMRVQSSVVGGAGTLNDQTCPRLLLIPILRVAATLVQTWENSAGL